jgi:NMD protein affecting ribosome stability and mRNA decay
MSECPKCSGRMKTVVRSVTIDEDLGGGRIARSEKRIERMVCRKCGYVQMTGDAIANSA